MNERMFRKIKLSKISSVKNPKYDSPSWEEYNDDLAEKYTLPVEYNAHGYLLADISIGKPCRIAKNRSNGNKSFGFVTTSIVQKIINQSDDFILFETMNSVYRIIFEEEVNRDQKLKDLGYEEPTEEEKRSILNRNLFLLNLDRK